MIEDNEPGNPGEEAIFDVLGINDKIQNIDLVGNNISEDLLASINSKLNVLPHNSRIHIDNIQYIQN